MKISTALKCYGSGYITFRENVDDAKRVSDISKLDGFFLWGDTSEDTRYLSYHGPWDEMILHDLDSISDDIIAGEFDFREEDKRIWKIRFNPNKKEWDEIQPLLVYGMNKGLSKAGLDMVYQALSDYAEKQRSDGEEQSAIELETLAAEFLEANVLQNAGELDI